MPMKILATSILIFIGLIVVSCEYFYSLEQPKSYFRNYISLKESGLIEKGWAPDFIPKSATDIHEQHDLDTNWVKMSFKFEPNDTASLSKACIVQNIKDETIYLCKNRGSEIKIITKNGFAQYSSKSI